MFPNVTSLSADFSRVCCTCPDEPEPVLPEEPVQQVLPLNPNNIPQAAAPNNDVNNEPNAAAPPPIDANPPAGPDALAPQPPANVEIVYEEDNCAVCCCKVMSSLSEWNLLSSLEIIGERCKDSGIQVLQNCYNLTNISLVLCTNYSLKLVLETVYHIARHQSNHHRWITIQINKNKFDKIIRLPNKPTNLRVLNADPDVTVTLWMLYLFNTRWR